ncbi:class I adenylate-forming enzyme family protein [Pseudofrankia inefficax]|uniref:AMP-dependent synthetase and ligase n=1 Tax=Pseudofrankia inefficax (strain DSM 45817 / CECT 9037 / DDB 130130 / EuI1c) TaxID=298654 RepID=E3IWL0_PSEI1|nr:class I adenylate-forming enzyme family protein [Pseudofrankia inefficax]ADP81340.1 AMP-dependent synthetase and ligase [Pseudofrankia inefficax]
MEAIGAGPPLSSVDYVRSTTLAAFIAQVCAEHRYREALVFDDPLIGGQTVRWSYGELLTRGRAVARSLIAGKVRPGDRVAILMANRPQAVAAFFGAAIAGAVVVPLSTFSTGPELATLLALADPAVLLAQTRMGNRDFAADLDRAPCRVAAVGRDWDSFLDEGTEVPDALLDDIQAELTPDSDGLVIFSSGTTARPKGVLHTQRAPTVQFWVQARLFGRTPATRMWTALPLFWTAGMNTAMGATLAAGGCWVMQEGFDPGHALRLMERERVTEPYTLPHQARALKEHPAWWTTDLSSLRQVFGKSVFSRHPTVHGDPSWQMPVGWGMSETCAFISAHPSDAGREAMRRSLGGIVPGAEIKVIDPGSGRVVERRVEGELLVRGMTLMKGYLGKDPAETFDAEGWLHTGDLGHLDDDGELHWTGRRTEMIRTGGVNVSPAEIEVQLRACPDVRLARVLGMPDERLGQIAVLCVELTEGADAESVRAFLRPRIASYKIPKRILVFEPGGIPLTESGTKVRDDDLRQLVEPRLAAKTTTNLEGGLNGRGPGDE